jgi:hypothetical protein
VAKLVDENLDQLLARPLDGPLRHPDGPGRLLRSAVGAGDAFRRAATVGAAWVTQGQKVRKTAVLDREWSMLRRVAGSRPPQHSNERKRSGSGVQAQKFSSGCSNRVESWQRFRYRGIFGGGKWEIRKKTVRVARVCVDKATAVVYTCDVARGETANGARPGTDGFDRRGVRSTHPRLGFLRVLQNAI